MRKLAVVAVLMFYAFLFANGQDNSKPESKQGEAKPTEAAPPAPKPLSYYRLDFAVNELEDSKKTNSRSYSVLVEAPGVASFKVGSRLPLIDEHGSLNYLDVGLNFQIKIQEKDSMLVVTVDGDISTVAAPEQGSPSNPPMIRSSNAPMIRQARFGGPTVVAPGKPTVLFSLDDVNSKHRFQIELTATKLK